MATFVATHSKTVTSTICSSIEKAIKTTQLPPYVSTITTAVVFTVWSSIFTTV